MPGKGLHMPGLLRGESHGRHQSRQVCAHPSVALFREIHAAELDHRGADVGRLLLLGGRRIEFLMAQEWPRLLLLLVAAVAGCCSGVSSDPSGGLYLG